MSVWWQVAVPFLCQLVEVFLHEFKHHKQLVVFTDHLLQFDAVRMIQLFQSLNVSARGAGRVGFWVSVLVKTTPHEPTHSPPPKKTHTCITHLYTTYTHEMQVCA